jgi:hypothetical protein
MTELRSIEMALIKFEEAAIKHSEATEQGDYKTGNKNYTLLTKATNILKKDNELEKLSRFLNHKSVGVRLWAAAYLLAISDKEGLRVLKQIASETGIHSLTAKTTISEWEKGTLKL